jgi:riboflavin kinase/FMN adenylyltransferase
VYATYCRLNDVAGAPVFGSVTNVGVRPTVDGLHLRVESYLLDFPPAGMSDNLYGQSITLEFVERLRGEQRFASIDALRAQIARDAEQARQVL